MKTSTELKLNEIELRDTYDAVFHLVTAAKGAKEFYTLANNSARTETAEEAAAMDEKLISAWTGHPHLRIIDNSTDFDDKMKRLIGEISAFLGEPQPFEIERKFLINYPDIKRLEKNPLCRKVEIIQTYLKSTDNEEVRVRQRGENGNYIYYRTSKRKVTDIKRVETESRLSKEEYLSMLMEADTSKAIMEIELKDENETVSAPDFIEVIKEVTEDEKYKNASLARI